MIYLDNAATTYPKPEEVYVTLDNAQRRSAFNAGRGHYLEASKASENIEETRSLLCSMARAKNLVFTSSATHAINQIIGGLDFRENDIIYCSPFDHNAIARVLYAYQKTKKFKLKVIPIKDDLSIDLEKLEFNCMVDKPKAIFCTHVSNVTGYILPIEKIGMLAKQVNSLFIVDGAQAFGLVEVNMEKIPIDYYVFAGHKTLYGPFGIGGYFFNKACLGLTVFGGTGSDSLELEMPQNAPLRYEPSSMNVVAIKGLHKAACWLSGKNPLEHEREISCYAITMLKKIDGLIIYNQNDIETSTGIISFNLTGYKSEELAKILADDFSICVRGGYHCCPFIHDYLDSKKFSGTVRISFSYFNHKEDIDNLYRALEELSYES